MINGEKCPRLQIGRRSDRSGPGGARAIRGKPGCRCQAGLRKENTNRYRSLSGAARAAEAAGDRQKAVGYFEKLVALSSKADTTRPELDHAKAFLGRR